MIIVATLQNAKVQPIVIIDYTRSDDNYSASEIQKYSDKACSDFTQKNSTQGINKPIVYSLNYDYTFTHSGLNVGDSKRTAFHATVLNAPNDLVGVLRIKEVMSATNFSLLANGLSRVADSEVSFPTGLLITKMVSGKSLTRPFTIYSTPYTPDRFRVENRLELFGGAFDDVVLRLALSAEFKKTISLQAQIINLMENTPYTLSFQFPYEQQPTIDRYYPPAPLNVILEDICRDNKLTFKVEGATYTFLSLDPTAAPSASYKNQFSFLNSVKDTKLVSNLTFSNYAIANIETELYDASLFESIVVYDDSSFKETPGAATSNRLDIFYNLNKVSGLSKKYNAYSFYVIGYTITDTRNATFIKIIGSNNWLLNNIKVDALFEPAIYRNLAL